MAPMPPAAHGETPPSLDAGELARTLKPIASEPRLRLLQFLAQPHYLEEIASHLHMARQSAQHHVDRLLAAGAIRKQPGHRETGPVTEYVVAPQCFFGLSEDLLRMGTLRSVSRAAGMDETQQADPGDRAHAGKEPALVEVHGMNPGRRFRLHGPGPWTLGRDEVREVSMGHDPFASGKHAKLVAEGGGHAVIDLFSTNGTTVNWCQIPEGTKHVLGHGDIVGVGKTLFVYWA